MNEFVLRCLLFLVAFVALSFLGWLIRRLTDWNADFLVGWWCAMAFAVLFPSKRSEGRA